MLPAQFGVDWSKRIPTVMEASSGARWHRAEEGKGLTSVPPSSLGRYAKLRFKQYFKMKPVVMALQTPK